MSADRASSKKYSPVTPASATYTYRERGSCFVITRHAAAQDFKVEKARLQAALERANGERARLSYELAEMKRRAEDSRVAERVENVMLSGVP